MNSNGILHMTVNPDGRLNLWDTPQDAVKSKEANEVVVQIALTKSQMALVLRAEGLARQKSAPPDRGPHSGTSASGTGY